MKENKKQEEETNEKVQKRRGQLFLVFFLREKKDYRPLIQRKKRERRGNREIKTA